MANAAANLKSDAVERRQMLIGGEWVDAQSVLTCRDALVTLARQWCV